MDAQRCQNHGPVSLLVPLLEFNHRFIFAFFSKGPPVTNGKAQRGKGKGSEGFLPSTFRPTYPSVAASCARKPGTLDGIARRASDQVRSYFGTWATSRAKTIFAILIASCSLKRWVQVAAFTC